MYAVDAGLRLLQVARGPYIDAYVLSLRMQVYKTFSLQKAT